METKNVSSPGVDVPPADSAEGKGNEPSQAPCKCATAQLVGGWMFFGAACITAVTYLTSVAEGTSDNAPHMGLLYASAVLLGCWIGAQDRSALFIAGWWRRPRVYAIAFAFLLIGAVLLSVIGSSIGYLGSTEIPESADHIAPDEHDWVSVRDLPDNMFVDRRTMKTMRYFEEGEALPPRDLRGDD